MVLQLYRWHCRANSLLHRSVSLHQRSLYRHHDDGRGHRLWWPLRLSRLIPSQGTRAENLARTPRQASLAPRTRGRYPPRPPSLRHPAPATPPQTPSHPFRRDARNNRYNAHRLRRRFHFRHDHWQWKRPSAAGLHHHHPGHRLGERHHHRLHHLHPHGQLAALGELLRTSALRSPQPRPGEQQARDRNNQLRPYKRDEVAERADRRHARLRIAQSRQTKDQCNGKR